MARRDTIGYARLENRERLRLRIRQMARRVQDAAEAEMDARFEAELESGRVPEWDMTNVEIRALLRDGAERVLGLKGDA